MATQHHDSIADRAAQTAAHPIDRLAAAEATAHLAEALDRSGRVAATGGVGSSTVFVAAALAERLARPVILTLAHLDEADEAEAELAAAGRDRLLLHAVEAGSGSGDTALTADQLAQRLAALRTIAELPADASPVILCPIQSLMQRCPPPDRIAELVRTVRRGEETPPDELVRWLDRTGYRRTETVEEPGEFALRGGILDIYPPGQAPPVRLDYFGDEIDRLTEIDLETQGSDRAIDDAELIAADPDSAIDPKAMIPAPDLLPRRCAVVLAETMEIVEQARGYYERATDPDRIDGPPAVLQRLETRFAGLAEINAFSSPRSADDTPLDLPASRLPEIPRQLDKAIAELAELAGQQQAIAACQNAGEASRLRELIAEHAPDAAHRIDILETYVHRGYVWDDSAGDAHAVVPYHELLHRFETRRRQARVKSGRAMDTFLDLEPGDYVVHHEHGIARFVGLELLPLRRPAGQPKQPKTAPAKAGPKPGWKTASPEQEYLTLEFSGGSRLHVPATQIDLVQKYVGGFAGKPPLSALGGAKWKNQRDRVAESVRDLAAEMLRVRAAREHLPGTRYPDDTPWQREFEAEFPYEETEDQLAALQEIKKDMAGPRPMDRLVCGDVGFGKTELAIRAAFKACEYGKQVAVLVPTTVLAEQHERTFRARFADYPFRVESLSRYKSAKQINATLADVRKGRVDVIIGTHRLLSKDVRFGDLGLVVIDEEQRFGVEHKERLLQLRMTVDVLTLSATPIPRTLHMSMLGLRDISSLTTAPLDRRAVVTEAIPYNAQRIKRAIDRELARQGQVFFLHNRVNNIQAVADDIRALAPDAKVVVGHGQMPPAELEAVMLAFLRREADILVSTTIIESGVDIPTANTILINDADRFGLADLHQLRGRVGRSRHRGYCYLLLPEDRPVKEVAQKRLKAVERYAMLGAGFKIAMRDLEIRGAGNLLGAEQSGHIAAVGYEMYCRLLERAVKDLTPGEEPAPAVGATVDLGVPATFPRAYIPSDTRRLEAYRRIATSAGPEELAKARQDLVSAYGTPPAAAESLFALAAIRAQATSLGVHTLTLRGPHAVCLAADPTPVAQRLRETAPDADDVRVIEAELAQSNARNAEGHRVAEVYLKLGADQLAPDELLGTLAARLAADPIKGDAAQANERKPASSG